MQGNQHPLHKNIEDIIPMEEFGTDPITYYNEFLAILDGEE
jgi:hypothetical protein